MKLKPIQDEEIATAIIIKMLGWKWMSFIGIPTRDTEGYPEKRRVRELFSPKQLKSKQWIDYLSQNEGREADGTEPLSYSYCSSAGPAMPPRLFVLIDDWNE